MNKYNIEVGDKVSILSKENDFETIVSFNPNGNEGGGFNLSSTGYWPFSFLESEMLKDCAGFEKVTKMNKGKIVGYKLAKETPEFNAGQVFVIGQHDDLGDVYIPEGQEDNMYYWYSIENVENKPHFFEPIYELIKPTEVKVQTLAGEVLVNKNWLTIKGEQPVPLENANKLFGALKNFYFGKRQINELHAATIETFKVGCKTFHINDIPKIEEAIKQVS